MPTPLPVIETIRDAFQFVWDKRARMVRALMIPAIAIFILEYFPYSTSELSESDDTHIYNQAVYSWLYFLVYMAPYILFAITCHRLALIGDQGVPNYGLLKWTQRETRYLGWSFVITIIAGLASFVINSLFLSKVISDVDAGAGVDSSTLALSLSGIYSNKHLTEPVAPPAPGP